MVFVDVTHIIFPQWFLYDHYFLILEMCPCCDPWKELGFYNQSICDYLWLFVIYNYHWLFLQLLFTFGCACNYTTTTLQLMFSSFFPFEQFLTWSSSKKTHLCSISCKCGQMSCNPMCLQCVFCVFQGAWIYNGF
jgi:hypothetical protein